MNQFRTAALPSFAVSTLVFLGCAAAQAFLAQQDTLNSMPIAAYLYLAPIQVAVVVLWLNHSKQIPLAKATALSVGVVAPLTLAGLVGLAAVYLHFGGKP